MHIVNICFSPTGGTQRTADMLVQAMAARSTAIDLSDGQIPFSTLSLQEDDVAVIAVPSYGGYRSQLLTAFLPSTETMPGPS